MQDVGPQHQPKIVINQTFARQLLGLSAHGLNTDDNGLALQPVIGRRIQLDIEQQPFQVIGVVADVQLPGLATTPPRFYMTNLGTALWLLIKLEPGAKFDKLAMIKALQQAHSQFALTHFAPLSELTDRLYLPQQLLALGALALALFTVLISGVGLVGVMQYNQQLRRSEFCIRLALGARFQQIVRESAREYLYLLLGAMLISLVILLMLWALSRLQAALTTSLMSADLHSASSRWWHPLSLYGFTLMLITACAAIAHYLPLRRLNTPAISPGLRAAG